MKIGTKTFRSHRPAMGRVSPDGFVAERDLARVRLEAHRHTSGAKRSVPDLLAHVCFRLTKETARCSLSFLIERYRHLTRQARDKCNGNWNEENGGPFCSHRSWQATERVRRVVESTPNHREALHRSPLKRKLRGSRSRRRRRSQRRQQLGHSWWRR